MKRTAHAAVSLLLAALLLLSACSVGPEKEEKSAFRPGQEPTLEESAVYTFSDGETVDRWGWESGNKIYRLSNGTDLLYESIPTGPQDEFDEDSASFNDLNWLARRRVAAYYEEQGLLYDRETALERAYLDYCTPSDRGFAFYQHSLRQQVFPMASNSRIICFTTKVHITLDRVYSTEWILGAIFDRRTGKQLSLWDLFTVPEEEARQRLLDALSLDSDEKREEYAAALQPEYFNLTSDDIWVHFSPNSRPSDPRPLLAFIDYEELEDILQPWAIPDPPAEALEAE